MRDESVTELIERLSSSAADSAWTQFLGQYSPLIKHLVGRHEHDHERAIECFTYVCGALSDDGFRKLRSFRPVGPARFQTWLAAVVSNLCCDWRRKQQGRIRPFGSVARLPELDRQVYRCIFIRRMTRAECVGTLAPEFPGLAEAQVAEVSARLFALLTPQQRWHLSTRVHAPGRQIGGVVPADGEPEWEAPAPDAGPEELAAEWQELQRLRDAMSALRPDQRLLLRLRYEQGLTLAEVARLTRQPDPFRANRQIQAALEALARLMGAPGSGPGRKIR